MTEPNAPDIVCLGEPMAEFSQLPGGPADRYLAGYGGDTSNCAIAAARQGASVGYVTALGADRFGDAFIALWRREGVDCRHVLRNARAHTAVYFIDHDADGHHFSYLRAGSAAARITAADMPDGYIAGAKTLHLSGISQAISDGASDAVFHAVETARAHGVLVSYDPNLRLSLWPLDRARAVIHATIDRADFILTNLAEASLLTGESEPERIADAYLARGPSVVAVKDGANGAYIATATERVHVAGHAVETVDASGAGDTFDGAFLAETVRGIGPLAAARYANAAAALSTTGYGAVTPIPTREAVEAMRREAAN